MKSIEHRDRWNKGKLVVQKPPLKPKDLWAIRIHLQNAHLYAIWRCSIWRSTASCAAATL